VRLLPKFDLPRSHPVRGAFCRWEPDEPRSTFPNGHPFRGKIGRLHGLGTHPWAPGPRFAFIGHGFNYAPLQDGRRLSSATHASRLHAPELANLPRPSLGAGLLLL
jgi:hypothetical protein